MTRMRLRRVSTLFLIGTAFLLATAAWADAAAPPKKPKPKAPAPKYQVQCQPGVMRAIVWVTGDIKGLANLPEAYTTDATMFHYRWNCTGRRDRREKVDRRLRPAHRGDHLRVGPRDGADPTCPSRARSPSTRTAPST